ncbi:transporter substrate-binding domain-containing protein [Streptomyces thermolilacinus]|uniref:ABC transporter substrate-binding protein n=1 Tax=Streptomyces thermolilacinus SPC6 TaxID=1306406 RepID=A0A1D3DTQ5_9ACTN|nr:transporter substrate-binding domain-containing protein [Streptomyces thermolilacinus]OEJ95710.1 ABC transporter substrate-binding protein [Streptomyces thermolilacinus SPC6]
MSDALTLTRPAATLEGVRARGAVRAVVSRGIRGLSLRGADGTWTGLDTDVARAVAAAALGDPDAVEWLPSDPAGRLDPLRAGDADLTVCNLTWTLGREAAWPVLFAGVTCYDGEGFLVRQGSGVEHPEDLHGKRLAVQAGTTSAANLAAWYGPRGLAVEPVAYPTPAETLAAYASGDCAAYVLDRTALAGERAALPDPEAHVILDAAISREPMAAAVRDDDADWYRLCRWVLQLLVAAEHHADEAERGPGGRAEGLAEAARLAGRHGPSLGLDEGWAARVLDATGTYGDIYERNLGAASGLGVPRGLNELWTRGGLHFAVPLV